MYDSEAGLESFPLYWRPNPTKILELESDSLSTKKMEIVEFLKSFAPSSPFLPRYLLKWDDDEDKLVKHISKAKDLVFQLFVTFHMLEYHIIIIFVILIILEWVCNHVILHAYVCK